MGIIGVPESAVYGNASEVPDSESGQQGVHAVVELDNGSSEEASADAQAARLVDGDAQPQG
jgi:hypothetical protein